MPDATPEPGKRVVSRPPADVELRLAGGELVRVGGATTAHVEGSGKPGTFQPEFGPDEIDRALWEIAAHGGNVARAHQTLSQWCGAQEPPERCPSRRTMHNWKDGLHRNRYHEIATARARDLDEVMARAHVDLAVRQADLEGEAMRKIEERLAGADAVEASMILRNISGAKKNNVDGAQNLRGRSAGHLGARSVGQIAAALARLGVVTFEGSSEDDPEDAELVEG